MTNSIEDKAKWILDCENVEVSIICATRDSKKMLEAYIVNSLLVSKAFIEAIEVIEDYADEDSYGYPGYHDAKCCDYGEKARNFLKTVRGKE